MSSCKTFACWKTNHGQIVACFVTMQANIDAGKVCRFTALQEAPEGGFVVTSPLDPELVTEAESVGEAFENARDALRAIKQSRAKLLRKLSVAP